MSHETDIRRNLKMNVVSEEIKEILEIHINSPRFTVPYLMALAACSHRLTDDLGVSSVGCGR